MSRRALIAVGCNDYDYLQPLLGAEADARRIYKALIKPEIGDYEADYSRLLLSPTLSALRDAIREILFAATKLDTFTFFFAGHGGVRSGSFYMCVKDTQFDALSASALSLAQLLQNLGEAAPTQSNIMIDACESGGLIEDLGVLLKPSMIGDAGTPGITLLASSAQDQYSGETAAGGLGTNAILDCIEGREFVQDQAAVLDLIEIGRQVSARLRVATNQTPVVWGLNLYGPPRFCRNPFFGSDPTKPLRALLQSWPKESDVSVGEHSDRLWTVYATSSGQWNARSFADTVTTILEPLEATPDALVGFTDRLGAALMERAALSEDAYRPAQVGAALAACLLRYGDEAFVARHTASFQQTIGLAVNAASSLLIDSLDNSRYALLGAKGGLSDLFYLPARIAKVLGWAGLAGQLFPHGSDQQAEADRLFTLLLRTLLEQYELSIVAMSDAQAPCWAIALARAARVGLHEEGERLAGLLFSSLAQCAGQVAGLDIAHDKVLSYLLMRRVGKFDSDPNLVARPTLTATVVLKAAGLFGLQEVFDDDLWRLDGVPLAAYFPDDLRKFADKHMEGGQNVIWQIGHDVFRVGDLEASWPAVTGETANPTLCVGAAMASLLYPNRVAWFDLEQASTTKATLQVPVACASETASASPTAPI